MYVAMRGTFPKIQWSRIICNNPGLLKWIFIFRLAALRRLHTKDRLMKWGVLGEQQCALCERAYETTNHLFFCYDYAKNIWSKILQWQGIHRQVLSWQKELSWACTYANGKGSRDTIYRMSLTATMYQRIFQSKRSLPQVITRKIVQERIPDSFTGQKNRRA
ncbi:hypothetical protein R3W88_008581 [Solanum pinnatisectum]|uniref:Reverse transcriptase zinc-binding domain-containing protein n=1 Tax=Solanum pinnatisectum TaxID=50273 RepID=A0AAV9M8G9_9SOLN|nr:hypothetical protein R3W88_008581 [Solanum pinnatisectum]